MPRNQRDSSEYAAQVTQAFTSGDRVKTTDGNTGTVCGCFQNTNGQFVEVLLDGDGGRKHSYPAWRLTRTETLF